MKCPTIWLKARTEEYCVKPSKQNSFDVCLSRRVSPWTMWVLKSSKFYSCFKTFPPCCVMIISVLWGQKNSKAKGPSQVSNVEKWKSTAFWTNFVHRMSPCSRFHTHTYTSLYSLTFTHLKSIFSSKNNFPWKCKVPFRFWKKSSPLEKSFKSFKEKL